MVSNRWFSRWVICWQVAQSSANSPVLMQEHQHGLCCILWGNFRFRMSSQDIGTFVTFLPLKTQHVQLVYSDAHQLNHWYNAKLVDQTKDRDNTVHTSLIMWPSSKPTMPTCCSITILSLILTASCKHCFLQPWYAFTTCFTAHLWHCMPVEC